MYETYWNLAEKPFINTVNPKFFFYGETYEEAYHRMFYTIAGSYGSMVLTSEGGSGKTFVCRTMFKQMIEHGFKAAYITNPDYEPFEFLQQIACEYGLDFRSKSKVELVKDLKDFFLKNSEKNTKVVLFIDDCHLVQSKRTLEELHLLLNWEVNNSTALTIIFAGKPEFVQMLKRVPSLQERVTMQYSIAPLNYQETGEYIYHRLKKAGCEKEIFSVEAIEEIASYSQGYPRQINTVCDFALFLGFGQSATAIDASLVQKALDNSKSTTIVKKH